MPPGRHPGHGQIGRRHTQEQARTQPFVDQATVLAQEAEARQPGVLPLEIGSGVHGRLGAQAWQCGGQTIKDRSDRGEQDIVVIEAAGVAGHAVGPGSSGPRADL